ncbi:breast cancer type 2 susceptibility protein isoform X2 [Pseudoliparis swirei]|uniref:breast cancer type 2 susceptibility protein isoform X2 n=1 Tax=Pseudoliparis swirei TaxID=2059687 RepID=UPI0024BD7163|nr:breast cancer type 2 susceptibility protein isoform X2 [Pseudoliparis swirei]
MSKEGIPGANNRGFHQDRFDLLHTPHKYPVSYDKQISESLGAQLHPDISWTSSLNTPPAVPSTLILSKSDESPCPVSVSADKHVVFVRTLFPSLSNASRVGAVALKNKDVPTVHQGVQHLESHDSPQRSLNQSDLVWKQTLPDAIEDGEIRRTVAGVLDGAEHVLSIFFTNSSSALRKVKTDRIKRKHIFSTKEHGCSSADVSLTNSAASSDQRTVDEEPGRLTSPPPVKTVDCGITQWSPLSLSELPPCTVDSSHHNNSPAVHVENNISTEQLHHDSGQLMVRPLMRHTDSGFTKKKRTFVYTVETPKLQVQGKETECQRMDSSPVPDSGREVKVKQLKAPDEADRCSVGMNEVQKRGNLVDVNLRPSLQPKVQDLDMSQLCKDFAQDFSQMSDPCKVGEDTPGNGFSPSTCLSAMKRAKQKAMQAKPPHYWDGVGPRRQNNPINERTTSDSGFQSAGADSANGTVPSFVLPSSEMNGLQWTDKQRATPVTSTNKGNGKAFFDDILQESKTDAKRSSAIGESQTLGPGRESELQRESTSARRASSAKEAFDNIHSISLNGQACGNLPEKTVSHPSVHPAGFTTASNKGIHVSSSNLERAKRLFAETEGERTSSDQPTKCAHHTKVERSVSHGSGINPTTNSNKTFSSSKPNEDIRCQLTVSQKADVTELCSLLEEADSQFEFTQFKTEMPKQNCQATAASPRKVHKELDPEFLSGIDFDDSFSSEAEKHLAAIVMPDKMISISDGKRNCETSDVTRISTGLSLSSAVKKENSSNSSQHISEGSSSVMSAEPKNLDGAGHELQNKIPLMLGVGFKTAGGNVLRVSKKCLSKAKALFAGLEENLVTSPTSPDKRSSKADAQRPFGLSVDKPTNNFLHHKEDQSSFTACGDDTEGGLQDGFSNTNGQVTCIRDGEAAKSLSCKKDTDACQSGFQMASGKGISVAAKTMQEAEALFSDCHTIDSNACKKSIEALPGSVGHEGTLPKCEVQGMKVNWSKEPLREFENVNAGPAACQTEVVKPNEETHNLGFTKTTITNDADPYSPAKTLSSLSCTSSKNIGSSANRELSSGGGFCSASGNKVSLPADAPKEGERLLNEIPTPGDANEQQKRKGDALRSVHRCYPVQCSPPQSGGFQTASGKGVAISSAALKKAKMLIECDEVKDTIFVKPTHSKMPVPVPTPRNSGFLAASGKQVAFSSEALQKAKALFGDIGLDAEIPAAADTRDSNKTQDKAEVPEKMHCGFTTAGGAKVHVSKKNLLEAKNLLADFDDGSISAEAMQEADAFFKDCVTMDGNDGMSVKQKNGLTPDCGSGSEMKHPVRGKVDQRLNINISEELRRGPAEFENVSVGLVENQKEMLHPDVEIHKGAFKKTLAVSNAAALHGNPSLMTKTLPPLSCTTSKNISSPTMNELSKGAGFCTASGKKVSVSADAMTKAKSLLNESATFEDSNKPLKHEESTFPPQNGGFQTASGNRVAISSAALKKVKTLFTECDVEDTIFVKPTNSKMPVPGPTPRNSGFLAASEKQVAFSSEALQKAKALFGDIGLDAEIPAVPDTRDSNKTQDKAEVPEKIHCGFTTAGGAKVHVSKKTLLEAKNLLADFDDGSISAEAMQEADAFFKDCVTMDGNDGMSVKQKKGLAPGCGSGSEMKHPVRGKVDQRLNINISEELRRGPAEFENVSVGLVENQEEMLHPDVEIHKGAFKKTLAVSNAAALHGNPSLMTKTLPPLSCTSKNISSPTMNELSKGAGFCTASGKKVSVSADAMTKAKSLLNESATFEDSNKPLKHEESTFPPQNGGFQTASGNRVAISSAALKKVKTLFTECDVEDTIFVKPTNSKMPVPGPTPRNSGFLAASGKQVAFSSEALQKAKALFGDIGLDAEIPAAADTRDSNKTQDKAEVPEKIHCGFTTAGGAKVHVSKKTLLEAKNLLADFADVKCPDSNSTRPHDICRPDPSIVKGVKIPCNASTGADMDMFSPPQVVQSLSSSQETDHENESPQSRSVPGCILVKDQAHADAFRVKEGHISPALLGNLHGGLVEDVSGLLGYKIQQTSSREGSRVKRPQVSSVLNFQSLNLSGCTETQQKLFAQEALDCTTALLEDESLAGQSLSMTSENTSHRSVPGRQGTEKRLIEDPDITGQPPLKRRFLEEFDRTVDGPRSSTLHPEKSCPNGVMKDRRVFKYSVSLQPNITRPHAEGNMYVETRLHNTTPTQRSTPEENPSAHSGKPAFVPPFLTNTKTENRKNTMVKDNIRTPSAFVPPFKKQRPFVQQSSAKPQVEEKEDKHHHLFVTPFHRNPSVPPTHTQRSTSELTGDKSKEDIETVALAHNANDNLMNEEQLPVGCGSKDSAAETSHMEDTFSRSQDIFQNVELARDMQDMRIRKKKRQTIRPFPGSLFLTKSSGATRIPLTTAVNGRPPARYTPKQLYGHGVHQHVCEISSETAESFRFNLKQFIKREAFLNGGGVQLADGGWLIPSKDGTAGKEEFYRALCDTPGVDPKLISEAWVYNHYRWVVWKQASMERSFPETMGGLCLTPEQVLLQLKYRYDVEVDHSRRPALRKITEKDDTAAKTLVLCVCGVVSRGHSPNRQSFNDTKTPQGADARIESPSAVVWLTDGWYAIKAQLDEPLTTMLHNGRVAVGGKLIIHGAQLVGSQEACPPLEAPESLMLKICTNSCRPTRWNTRLGFHRDPRPFLLPVSCLYSNGGPVGCVDIVVLRSYPLQWMERKPGGGVVFRSVRAEEKEARRYNGLKQKAMEILFAKIQDAFEKEDKDDNKRQRRRRTISRQGIASLQAGEELYEAVGDDPVYLQAHLSEQQLETLGAYRCSLMEKRQAELQDRYRRALESAEDSEGSCPRRDVTPVWRLCVADSMAQHGSVHQLNLWRPSSDLQSLLKEGCRYKVYNLTTSDGKKHGAVQLTGSKKTRFQDLQAPQEWLATRFQPRVSTRTVDLQKPEFQSLCGEVDVTGYVISIIDGQGFSPAFYVADGELNFVKVRCFSSFAQSGLEELVKPRVLLALSNLQLRGQSTSPTPVVYAGDLTLFSTNPKKGHLQESLSQNKNLVQSQENFFLKAEEKLSYLVRSDGLRSISSPALQTRTPAFTPVRRKDTKATLVRSLGSFTPVSRKPPAANCSTEKDPSSMTRRRAQDYLSRIPSPPPLLHLGSESSPCVNKTFNPPWRSGTTSTLNTAQTPARKPGNPPVEDEWVNDEELAMIDTQALHVGDLL